MREYPEQLDYAWLAVDSVGHLAVFITGGVGPIPEAALMDEMSIVEIESKLLELPPVGPVSLVVKVPSPESFIALAERGLFVFDWQNAHRARAESKPGYDLVAIPGRTIEITAIPPNLTGKAKAIFSNHLFGQERILDVESALPCLLSPKL